MPLSSAAVLNSPATTVSHLAKLIATHPLPNLPQLPVPTPLPPALLEPLLARLFSGHSHPFKLLHLLHLHLHHPLPPSPRAFHLALLSLSRSRLFPHAIALLRRHPHFLSPKSLSTFLHPFVKSHPFDRALQVFDEVRHWPPPSPTFGPDHLNALLRAFCVHRKMMEARAAFRRLHSELGTNTKTMNTLLLGFKESRGGVTAMELFYAELVARGFEPDVVTYNIRVDAYCKKGSLRDAMDVVEEMEETENCQPNLETMTTLIHGACIAQETARARQLFDEMYKRGFAPDTCAYNALISALVRAKELKAAVEVVEEMESKGVGLNDATYHAVFWGMKRHGGVEGVCWVVRRMVERGFVPKARTVVMLMKYFCERRRVDVDMGLKLWDYMVENGCCPHGHALDLLVAALCRGGKVDEAYRCFKQVVEMGRCPPERSCRVLKGFLLESGREEMVREMEGMVREMEGMVRRLQEVVPTIEGQDLYPFWHTEDTSGANSPCPDAI